MAEPEYVAAQELASRRDVQGHARDPGSQTTRRSAGTSHTEGGDVPGLQVGNGEGIHGTKGAFYPRPVAARAQLFPPSTLPLMCIQNHQW